jgi:hypothetical protein
MYEGGGKERSPRKLDISSQEGLKELANGIMEIDEVMDESPYERVVIQYPFPLLEVRARVLTREPSFGTPSHC